VAPSPAAGLRRCLPRHPLPETCRCRRGLAAPAPAAAEMKKAAEMQAAGHPFKPDAPLAVISVVAINHRGSGGGGGWDGGGGAGIRGGW
jgi:hypothetical protein